MAGTSTKTQVIAVRWPNRIANLARARAEARGVDVNRVFVEAVEAAWQHDIQPGETAPAAGDGYCRMAGKP